MLGFLKIFYLLVLHNLILAECSVPILSVQKLDRKIIERKRQDTREMCRLFNSETGNIQDDSHYAIIKKTLTDSKRRSKREVSEEKVKYGNPMLSEKDARRVESIIDKLYDDVDEDGKNIPYRKKKIDTSTVQIGVNKTEGSRRFDFAPAELLGPKKPLNESSSSLLSSNKNVTNFHMPWPKKWFHGIVPYFIDPKTYDNHLVEVIVNAFDYFEHATCIRLQRLRERPVDKKSLSSAEWIYITNPSGIRQCVHSNEKMVNKGVQIVVFGYDCMSLGEIVHEVMHVLGFSHEHTRPDRDAYINVLWENIKPGYKKYFEVRKEDSLMQLPYDYSSVMHYPPRAFSKNGKLTILTEASIKLGQRQALSETDVDKVGMIFGQDCTERNRVYLLKTCPVVTANRTTVNHIVKPENIEKYYKGRIWPFGIVNYKLRDRIEFSIEEKENIKAVIRHIEKETCIEFRDVSDDDSNENNEENNSNILQTEGHWGRVVLNDNDLGLVDSENDNVDGDNDGDGIQNLKTAVESPDRYNLPRVELGTDNIRKSGNKTTTTTATSNSNNANNISKVEDLKIRKVRSKRSMLPSPTRRHANSILILTRSAKPGCECPKSGLAEGNQMIELSTDCFNSANDLLHVFGHILGLDHQHKMWDRDEYLHIQWDELTDEVKQEMKQTLPIEASVGFPYDYQSVMHYPWLQIKNGVTNIVYPVWNDGWAMGHWQGLSSTDVRKLKTLYFKQCVERKKHAEDNSLE